MNFLGGSGNCSSSKQRRREAGIAFLIQALAFFSFLGSYQRQFRQQAIAIKSVFKLIEVLFNHIALSIDGQGFKSIRYVIATKRKVTGTLHSLVDF